ncbi:class I SAM-dependent methyltransferase [Aquibium sp. A9E412]|uniref:class I SAM-dependent DNA methyltransferase n=1 Tax=Aquibium sp. A9E412 TaxID=2976767 RepID=UPI0025B1BF5C|nr:class I SAM-dependent methyltransferase [Aquibium sp. A9E412]MDN2565717.1 class I SAM-dependent methyltransferase [Aquibium sp. A9E412]
MTAEQQSDALNRVYAADSRDALADAYGDWAAAYDRETAALGYCLPYLATAWLARHLPADAGPLLDAGCGTGLSGPYLAALGYRPIEGLDLSEAMLAHAAERGVYARLVRAALGEALPFEDGRFAGFLAAGVFTQGHAPAAAFDELVRATRPGGIGVATVRDRLVEEAGFGATFAALEAAGRCRVIEKSPPFRAFAVAEPDVFVHAYVLRVG